MQSKNFKMVIEKNGNGDKVVEFYFNSYTEMRIMYELVITSCYENVYCRTLSRSVYEEDKWVSCAMNE